MAKYLIFRNDRIGDFLITAILIRSIKRNDKKSHITVVASHKNYKYIKSFESIDRVILFDKNFLNLIKIIKYLRSFFFDYLIVHDNKKRSLFISRFLRYKKKIKVDKKKTHIKNISNILKKLNYRLNETDLNTLDKRRFKKINLPLKYMCFHFDEKWFNKIYISNYTNIEPSKKELAIFLKKLLKIFKTKIVVTTGHKTPKIKKLFSINNKKIILFDKIDYFQLEQIISNCKFLISCHGFVSHLAAAKKIPQIDIIDKSYNYSIWSSHFRKYKFVYRKKFSKLNEMIIKKI